MHTQRQIKTQDILRELMTDKNMSGQDLSRATGITQSTIQRILSGESESPRKATLEPIADYYNVSLSYLIGEDGPEASYRTHAIKGQIYSAVQAEADKLGFDIYSVDPVLLDKFYRSLFNIIKRPRLSDRDKNKIIGKLSELIDEVEESE